MALPRFNDLQLAGKVRTKGLEDVLLVLNDDPIINTWSSLKQQLIVKMSANLLPRLNEHTGQDGEELKIIPIYGGQSNKIQGHDSNQESI